MARPKKQKIKEKIVYPDTPFKAMLVKTFELLLAIVTGKQIGRASCRERVSSPV